MVELESKGELTRSEVAVFLREFVAELDAGLFEQQPEQGQARERNREDPAEGEAIDPERITLVGGNSATVTVPEAVDFDVRIESRSPMLSSSAHQGIEFDLSWEIENPDESSGDWIEIE